MMKKAVTIAAEAVATTAVVVRTKTSRATTAVVAGRSSVTVGAMNADGGNTVRWIIGGMIAGVALSADAALVPGV